MDRRELLKLFLASQLPLGGLFERIAGQDAAKSVDCQIEGWDVTFSERPGMCHCIQFYARKRIRGENYHICVLFDKDDEIEHIKKVMKAELARRNKRPQSRRVSLRA